MKNILISGLSINEFKEILADLVKANNSQPNVKPINKKEAFLTRKEVASLLKISLPTLHDYTKSGILKSYRLGKNIRYKQSDIDNALQEIKYIKYRRSQDFSAP